MAQEVGRRNEANAPRPPGERLRLIVWTINDAAELCELAGLGVDGIVTDEPGRLRSVVQHWFHPGSPPGCPVGMRREGRECVP